MSVSATSTPSPIWSQATSALTSVPPSKTVSPHKPNEAGGPGAPAKGQATATGNPFQSLSPDVQSALIRAQASGQS